MKAAAKRSLPSVALMAALAVALILGGGAGQLPTLHATKVDDVLPAGTYCQGAQAAQPAAGPKKVILLDLENESASSVQNSPDAPFQNNVLSGQCGSFATTAMHSTTHGSESNYLAQVSGLNAAISTGPDAVARFGLSDCPPDSTSSSCAFGGGHIPSSVPSLFSQIENAYGTSGWKVYADDMPANCNKTDANFYATDGTGKRYPKYVVRHNPAPYFQGIACSSQNIPSGAWQSGQGPLYTDLTGGTLPAFSFVVPNDIENGHDPSRVGGVTVAGGKSPIANIDNYLTSFMSMVQTSPEYQSGNLAVVITYDEGFTFGPVAGEGKVGENCADPNISPLATSCQVVTWVVGRYVPQYQYSTYMNQFGLLSATQRMLGLSPLLGHAADSSTPDIVNGTAANPNPFNLLPTGTVTPPPPTVPSPPKNVSATGGGGSATVSFTAPDSTGGAPITSYTVTSNPGGITATGTSSPITVPGLSIGTPYAFTVTAHNSAGDSNPSDPSNSVTPQAVTELLTNGGFENGMSGVGGYSSASKPAIVSSPVNGGVRALQVNNATTATTGFNAPVIPGSLLSAGQSLTGSCWVRATGSNYKARVRLSEGKTFIVIGEGVSDVLAPGVWTIVSITGTVQKTGDQMILSAYTTNQVGGAAGLVWDDCSVTTPAAGPAATVPDPPTALTPTPQGGRVRLNWTAPANNGGAPITDYAVQYSPSGAGTWTTFNDGVGTSTSAVVTGLTDGSGYDFQVAAINSAGTGSYSTLATAIPAPVAPDPPTIGTATAGDGQAVVAFTPPGYDGGDAITSYTVTSNPGGIVVTDTAGPITVTGLTDGTPYTFTVTASNGVGPSAASAASNSVTPRPPVVPAGPPTGVSAVAGNASAVVSFTPPADNGGAAITSYTVTSSPGGIAAAGSSSPITVKNLTVGTSYTFTVVANNSAGPGTTSAPSNSVTPYAELLPDPGFEQGNGGWVAFQVGTLTRITSPIHGGSRALRVAATSASAALVGLTQNSVVSNSVAGKAYTAQCYVQPTSASLNVQIRFLEYTQDFSKNIHLQTVSVNSLPTNKWTLVKVTSTAVNSGERMIPQIYSPNETTNTGSLIYDDCSVGAS